MKKEKQGEKRKEFHDEAPPPPEWNIYQTINLIIIPYARRNVKSIS